MKKPVYDYTFSATAKSITLGDLALRPLDLKRILLIVDVTTNAVLYNFVDPTVGTITVAGMTITFTHSNAGLADTDDLLILYDSPEDCEDEPGSSTDSLLLAIIARLDLIAAALVTDYEPIDSFGIERY